MWTHCGNQKGTKWDNSGLQINGNMLFSIRIKPEALKLQQHTGVTGHIADMLEPAAGAADNASAAQEAA